MELLVPRCCSLVLVGGLVPGLLVKFVELVGWRGWTGLWFSSFAGAVDDCHVCGGSRALLTGFDQIHDDP